MVHDSVPGGRLGRRGVPFGRTHRLATVLSVVTSLSLVGTASAFALTRHEGRGAEGRPSLGRYVGAAERVPVTTATTATTTTTSTSTTTSTTTTTTDPRPPPTTTGPPSTAPPPRVPVAAVPPPAAPTGCASALPAQLATTAGAHQIITVEAPGYGVTSAVLTAWQWSGSCWTVALGPWTARLGAAGMSTHKHEGDGATPAGIFGFQATMYGNAPNPGVHYAYRQLVCGDWWDEDSSSPTYNTFQEVPCSDTHPPFANGSSEALWTEGEAYPSFAVINYNPARVPGVGSAIFLHADVGGPTAGCVSVPLDDLDRLLDWLQPAQSPSIVLGTDSSLRSY